MRLLLIITIAVFLGGCASAPAPSATGRSYTVNFQPAYSGSPFIWPLTGTVTTYFETKVDRVKNKGIDIKAVSDYTVRASMAGKVVFCDEKLKGFGKTIILDHGNGFQTVYAYNSELLVRLGEDVGKGQAIAKAGKSGRAKEPSLHFEIRKNGEAQNPLQYLKR